MGYLVGLSKQLPVKNAAFLGNIVHFYKVAIIIWFSNKPFFAASTFEIVVLTHIEVFTMFDEQTQ